MKIATRDDHAYQARVWMRNSLTSTLENEALARIEAMLPAGYRYRINQGDVQGVNGHQHGGWVASFGDTEDGSGYGVPHAFSTKIGATIGLLAILADGCVFPGYATSWGQAKAVEQAKNSGEGLLVPADEPTAKSS